MSSKISRMLKRVSQSKAPSLWSKAPSDGFGFGLWHPHTERNLTDRRKKIRHRRKTLTGQRRNGRALRVLPLLPELTPWILMSEDNTRTRCRVMQKWLRMQKPFDKALKNDPRVTSCFKNPAFDAAWAFRGSVLQGAWEPMFSLCLVAERWVSGLIVRP